MRAKIAVATVSGRAYYKLVKELKSRDILFLSIIPGEKIPVTVKVVVTTEKEKDKITHPNILVYSEDEDPRQVIDEAVRILSGKDTYEELTIGVDPGKTFGVAVLGDGNVLRAEETSSMESVIDMILLTLNEYPASSKSIKIGGGVPELAERIVERLKRVLPEDVDIEIVNEEGTSHIKGENRSKKLSDADSAIKISRMRIRRG